MSMIRGIYRINPENAAAWHKLIQVCRSLAAEGTEYSTEIQRFGERSVVTVTATGGKACKRKKQCRRRASIVPAPVSLKRCQKQAEESKRAALRPGILLPERSYRWHSWRADSWREEQVSDRRVGRLVARAIARGEKFIDPVALKGGDEFYRVFEPEAVSAVIEGRRRKNHDYTFAGPTIAQRKAALAEYQYWRELEALSGQREKWKPGLTDGTFYADDEVSTHAA
jgi:hypothetical protein